MTGDIFIYGGIGTERGEVSFLNVKQQINDLGKRDNYVLHLISNGGDVFEGYAIYNALKNLGAPLETHIEGQCASIATLIAAAAPKIIMNRMGDFIIHNPHISDLSGDAPKIRKVADQLDQIKSTLISIYEAKTGLSKEKLWELYDNETRLNADNAAQMGFVDEAVDAIKAVAKLDSTKLFSEMEKNEQTKLQKFFNNIEKFFAEEKPKIKNQIALALADGRNILIMSEDDVVEGKPVTLEDGTPLAPGQYPLADGKVLTVDEIGNVTSIGEAPQNNANVEEKVKELEAQLAAAKQGTETAQQAAQTAETAATQAKLETVKYKNKLTEFEKEFISMKAEFSKTFGEEPEGTKGPVIKNASEDKPFDPMAELGEAYISSRPNSVKRKN